MGRTLNSSASIGGSGSSVTEPGTYHVQVLRSADGQSTKGNQISGCSAVLSVLAGTVQGQVGKEHSLHLFDPDMSKDEKSQDWSVKKQTAYAIAINQMAPSDLGKSVDVDFDNAEGQQFFINLEENDYNGEKSIQLAFANIYHVDDPRAKDFPRNEDAMKILPAELRKGPEYFEPLQGKPKAKKKEETRLQEADLDEL